MIKAFTYSKFLLMFQGIPETTYQAACTSAQRKKEDYTEREVTQPMVNKDNMDTVNLDR